MNKQVKQVLSWLLCFTLLFQFLGITTNSNVAYASSFIKIEEFRLDETILAEEHITEEQLAPIYITENLIYEDGIYEYRLSENIISQAYIIEATVGVTTTQEIFGQLPPGISDYDIDWLSVLGKFAAGTTIIIAVGVVNYATKGSTYFVFGSPVRVAKDALIGGAIGATLSTLLNCAVTGEVCDKAVMKYAIEGFADGYMWGAISSVLCIAGENYKRLTAFKTATGGSLRIKANGSVWDDAGRSIGNAYYCKDQLWYLVDDTTHVVRVFNAQGVEILQATNRLPANEILRLGTGTRYMSCRTDSNGFIYRIDDELLPNIQYQLNGYVYHTDSRGRIIQVDFSELKMKPMGQGRQVITDSSTTIGHGRWRTGDDRGHLIADRFNGNNTMGNIVPQSSLLNRGEIVELENNFARAIQEGHRVSGSIVISYSGGSYRPVGFTYTYDIGAGTVVQRFTN